MHNLIYAFLLYFIAQGMIWFQTYGQFIWPWIKNNPWTVSIVSGTLVSYIFIKATYFAVTYFDGLLWPPRFLGFASGMLIFTILTWFFMKEPITLKTGVSLLLATSLIFVQLFWK